MYFDMEKVKVNGKYLQLLGDFIIKEEVCNLSCDYCLSEGAKLKDKHSFERIDGKLNYRLDMLGELIYQEGSSLKQEVDRGLKIYYDNFDSPILKLSGGEVFLIRNFVELLRNQADKYEVIQVLTNGTLLDEEIIKELQSVPNVNIQFSLDGHSLSMNYNRVKSEEMNKRLLRNFDRLVQAGIPTEAYAVVSRQNIDHLPAFTEYLLDKYGSKIHFTFFPVRQGAAQKFLPSPDELQGLETLMSKYEEYKSILPPYQYIEEMHDYMKTGKRKSRCYVPLIMFQNFDDGIATPCPNCWTVNIGNLLEKPETVAGRIGQDSIYNLMTNSPPIAPFCIKCFADYHLFNLYFNDVVSLEELSRTRPLLQGPKVQKRLTELKDIFVTHLQGVEDLKRFKKNMLV